MGGSQGGRVLEIFCSFTCFFKILFDFKKLYVYIFFKLYEVVYLDCLTADNKSLDQVYFVRVQLS